MSKIKKATLVVVVVVVVVVDDAAVRVRGSGARRPTPERRAQPHALAAYVH